jgi:hypothetical protein
VGDEVTLKGRVEGNKKAKKGNMGIILLYPGRNHFPGDLSFTAGRNGNGPEW